MIIYKGIIFNHLIGFLLSHLKYLKCDTERQLLRDSQLNGFPHMYCWSNHSYIRLSTLEQIEPYHQCQLIILINSKETKSLQIGNIVKY